MPLQRRRAMKCGESWMGKRTINSILTLNRICIILICSISVLYNSVTQSHRMGNKMGDHEGIPPLSMMVDLSWLFSNLLLLLSPFLPPPTHLLPPCICSSIIPLSFAGGKKKKKHHHSFSVTNPESLLWFLPFAHFLETFHLQPSILKIQQRANSSRRCI